MAPLPLAHLVSPVVRGRGGVGEPARTTRHSPNRSTGQDAVAVIKNELKLLIPGIKIFLDVDDLKDIGSLEDYVDRTQVMLFFLSKGYFRSQALPQPLPFREPRCVAHDYSCAPCLQNCLREIRTSLEKSKPLVLVQEADPAKGGGTLQALPARPLLAAGIALATHGSEGRCRRRRRTPALTHAHRRCTTAGVASSVPGGPPAGDL